MRNMSFALTTEQVRTRTKTVTRRLGWARLQAGTLLQPVVKAQGLKKGEHVEKIGGPIRVVSVWREPLNTILNGSNRGLIYAWREVRLEGFPEMSPSEFFFMFCRHNGCTGSTRVTRIEFEYVEDQSHV